MKKIKKLISLILSLSFLSAPAALFSFADTLPLTEQFGTYDMWCSENGITFTEKDTLDEIDALITRRFGPGYASWFSFELDSSITADGFVLFKKSGTIGIKARNGANICAGIGYYLKNYCLVDYSSDKSDMQMPTQPVALASETEVSPSLPYRIAVPVENEYGLSFLTQDEAQKRLDICMLSGMNYVYDSTGFLPAFAAFITGFGTDDADVSDSICSCFSIGNFELTGKYLSSLLGLARKNVAFLKKMGAGIIAPAYNFDYEEYCADPQGSTINGFYSVREALLGSYDLLISHNGSFGDDEIFRRTPGVRDDSAVITDIMMLEPLSSFDIIHTGYIPVIDIKKPYPVSLSDVSDILSSMKNEKTKGMVFINPGEGSVLEDFILSKLYDDGIKPDDTFFGDYSYRRYRVSDASLTKGVSDIAKAKYGGNTSGSVPSELFEKIPSPDDERVFSLGFRREYLNLALASYLEVFELMRRSDVYVKDVVSLMLDNLLGAAAESYDLYIYSLNTENAEYAEKARTKLLSALALADEVCRYCAETISGHHLGSYEAYLKAEGFSGDERKAILSAYKKSLLTGDTAICSGFVYDYIYPLWEDYSNALAKGSITEFTADAEKSFADYTADTSYTSEPVLDAKGGSINRGLPTIWNEIRKGYLCYDGDYPEEYAANVLLRGYPTADGKYAPSLTDGKNDTGISFSDTDSVRIDLYGEYEIKKMRLSLTSAQPIDIVVSGINADNNASELFRLTNIVTGDIVFDTPKILTAVTVGLSGSDGKNVNRAFTLNEISAFTDYSLNYSGTEADIGTVEGKKTVTVPEGFTSGRLIAGFGSPDGLIIVDESRYILGNDDLLDEGMTVILMKNGYVADQAEVIIKEGGTPPTETAEPPKTTVEPPETSEPYDTRTVSLKTDTAVIDTEKPDDGTKGKDTAVIGADTERSVSGNNDGKSTAVTVIVLISVSAVLTAGGGAYVYIRMKKKK